MSRYNDFRYATLRAVENLLEKDQILSTSEVAGLVVNLMERIIRLEEEVDALRRQVSDDR